MYMTGYAGSWDYVGNLQSPWRTPHLSPHPTVKDDPDPVVADSDPLVAGSVTEPRHMLILVLYLQLHDARELDDGGGTAATHNSRHGDTVGYGRANFFRLFNTFLEYILCIQARMYFIARTEKILVYISSRNISTKDLFKTLKARQTCKINYWIHPQGGVTACHSQQCHPEHGCHPKHEEEPIRFVR